MIPETQRAAWEDIQERLPDKRAKVFGIIRIVVGGLTLWEIAANLNWTINCVSGRVTELKKAGLIRDSGKRRINPDSGKAGIVWIENVKIGQQELL